MFTIILSLNHFLPLKTSMTMWCIPSSSRYYLT